MIRFRPIRSDSLPNTKKNGVARIKAAPTISADVSSDTSNTVCKKNSA